MTTLESPQPGYSGNPHSWGLWNNVAIGDNYAGSYSLTVYSYQPRSALDASRARLNTGLHAINQHDIVVNALLQSSLGSCSDLATSLVAPRTPEKIPIDAEQARSVASMVFSAPSKQLLSGAMKSTINGFKVSRRMPHGQSGRLLHSEFNSSFMPFVFGIMLLRASDVLDDLVHLDVGKNLTVGALNNIVRADLHPRYNTAGGRLLARRIVRNNHMKNKGKQYVKQFSSGTLVKETALV